MSVHVVLAPVILVIGFVPLLWGADLVVRGASTIAARLGIAPIIVGLTLVAFGTSAPELVINVSAALTDQGSVALGNVLGSNIFNIAATLGLLAIVRSLPISRTTTWAEIPFALVAAVLMAVVGPNLVTRSEGLLLLGFFVAYMLYIVVLLRRTGEPPLVPDGMEETMPRNIWVAGMLIVTGLVLLTVGGQGVVWGAVESARWLNVPEYVIAATIVAIGTSLPELATGIAAVRRGEIDLAVGNAVGSNIFNVFLVLGATALIRPIQAPPRPIDHGVHILAVSMLFLFVFTGRGRRIERWEGILLVLLYLVYTTFLIVAG